MKQQYLIHFIDEIKNFDNKFELLTLKDQGQEFNLVKNDAFYIIQSDSPTDAIINIANLIEVLDSDGLSITLSQAIVNCSQEMEQNFNSLLIRHEEGFSKAKFISFYINRQDEQEEWIEYHQISFFIIEEGKIIKLETEE